MGQKSDCSRRRNEGHTSPPTVAIALEGAVMGIYLGECLIKG